MRTDAINWFASSELCRSLQDGGKTPLTLHEEIAKLYCYAAATVIPGDAPAWKSVSHTTRQWFLDEAFVLASYSLDRYGKHIVTNGGKC